MRWRSPDGVYAPLWEELEVNGILLLDESTDIIKKLPDREAGALIKAIINNDGSKLPPKADLVFPIIMGQVERMRALREKNTENGKKGGRPKKNPDETETKPKVNPNKTDSKTPYHTNTNTNNIYPYKGVQRSPKIQQKCGFSTERQNVNYNEIAAMLRAEREAAE